MSFTNKQFLDKQLLIFFQNGRFIVILCILRQ